MMNEALMCDLYTQFLQLQSELLLSRKICFIRLVQQLALPPHSGRVHGLNLLVGSGLSVWRLCVLLARCRGELFILI